MKRKHKGRADIWIRVIALIATLATIGAVAYVQFSGTNSKVEQAVTQLETGIGLPNDSGTEPAPSVEEDASSANSGFFPIIDESEPVDQSYFDDAVFIGDSILNGLRLSTEIGSNATWLVNDDMTVASAETVSIQLKDGTKTKLLDALAANQYAKVYVMVGINDLTIEAKEWAEQYESLLADIADLQPDAVIYVMAVTPASTTAAKNRASLDQANIVRHNQALFKVLWKNGYYYLDTWGQFADAHGYLASEDNTDGIHFITSKYQEMYEYICGRTVAN